MSPQVGVYTGIDADADIAAHAADYGLHTKAVNKTADETVNNSDTFQNDDELLLAIGANEVWAFELYLLSSSSAVADYKGKFVGPSGATVYAQFASSNHLPADQTLVGVGRVGGVFQKWHGVIINGATAGNLQFQWAQDAAEASDTKVLAGSCLVATQLA